MTELLVSVRSAEEAEAALRGGAHLIDVKDPDRGPLGRPADASVVAVVRAVAGRVPVSVAMGELAAEGADEPPPRFAGVHFLKWGLAGVEPGRESFWRPALAARCEQVRSWDGGCRVVAVAYADWRRAGAPSPEAVAAFARGRPGSVFLLDTWGKDGSTLLDWLSAAEVCRLTAACRRAGGRVALAGSLGVRAFAALRPAAADWLAVRGAACAGGERGGAVDEGRVRQLAGLLA